MGVSSSVCFSACGKSAVDEITQEEGLITADILMQKISGSATDDSNSRSDKVRINLDVVETIILEADSTEKLKRAEGRKSTGFVKAQVVEDAVVRIASDNSVSVTDAPPKIVRSSVTGKARKGTGFITKAQMADILNEEDSDDEELVTAPSDRAQSVERKQTGFVTTKKLQKVLRGAGEEEVVS
eukprot:TRINITY_DN43980_c0_g1_i1.p1 TRINITY_DN43980_c0_g1~~TRINITY_DN43980_c0_g1_i1.p1  ORF type:complete len:184 (-),score=47.40 TRINITY_DN43980_c0_g1_i1:127-678(-)